MYNKFLSKVNKTNTCWLWTGGKNKDGYGQFWCDGKDILSHRYSALIHNLPNPDNKPFVLHSCDNPSCVNPAHLRYGTHQENMLECSVKNRISNGEDRPLSKLTEKQVLEIRSKYIPFKCSLRKLAKEYGVSFPVVSRIINKQIWKHI